MINAKVSEDDKREDDEICGQPVADGVARTSVDEGGGGPTPPTPPTPPLLDQSPITIGGIDGGRLSPHLCLLCAGAAVLP